MAGNVVNIKVCGSLQHHLSLLVKSSEIRHYAYTHRYQPYRQNQQKSKEKIKTERPTKN